MEEIKHYFPEISQIQLHQFELAKLLYAEWNSKINVISKNDVEYIEIRHFLHSLTIAKFINFKKGSSILDIGTGGGFPGIPLAIMFPEVSFYLSDSIGKKIKVVNEIAKEIGLTNIKAEHIRAEEVKQQFDFVITRAVAPLADLLYWSRNKYKSKENNAIPNGLITLKGGDLRQEIADAKSKNHIIVDLFSIQKWFKNDFFETKKLLHVY